MDLRSQLQDEQVKTLSEELEQMLQDFQPDAELQRDKKRDLDWLTRVRPRAQDLSW